MATFVEFYSREGLVDHRNEAHKLRDQVFGFNISARLIDAGAGLSWIVNVGSVLESGMVLSRYAFRMPFSCLKSAAT